MTSTLLTLLQRRVQRWVLCSWLLLLTLVICGELMPRITWQRILFAALFCLPLLAPLPGLLRANRYTHVWATLCVLPYFIVGVAEAVANPGIRHWAEALLAAALLWFFSLIAFLRVTRPLPFTPSAE